MKPQQELELLIEQGCLNGPARLFSVQVVRGKKTGYLLANKSPFVVHSLEKFKPQLLTKYGLEDIVILEHLRDGVVEECVDKLGAMVKQLTLEEASAT